MWRSNYSDILVQFLTGCDMNQEDSRAVLGIALLAGSSPRLLARLEAFSADSQQLDTKLMWRVLQAASLKQLAGILWTPIGLHFSVDRFESLLMQVLAGRPSNRSLYEAVGGAVDFLRLHEGAFILPHGPLRRLMSSRNTQCRIVALKGMIWSDIPPVSHFESLLRSLQSADEEERFGGVYCLGELIKLRGSETFRRLPPDLLQRLADSLKPLSEGDDFDLRMAADSHRSALLGWIRR